MLNKLQKVGISLAGTAASVFSAATALAADSPLGTDIKPGKGWAMDFGSMINSVLTIVMVVALLLVLMYLILGGIEWITSGGDKGKTESARNKITAAIIGIIILAAAYALVQLVAWVLGFEDFNSSFDQIQRINPSTSGTKL